MRLLVTGANGQIGWELARSLMPLGHVTAMDRGACDLARPETLPEIVRGAKPDVLVKFLASPDSGTGVTAVGANWTIDVDTAANADKVIAALGGRVKGPSGPPGSSSGTTR